MCENFKSILCFCPLLPSLSPTSYNLFDLTLFFTPKQQSGAKANAPPLLPFRVWYGFNSVDNGSHRLTITPEQATFRLASGLSLPSKSALSDRRANWSCSYMSMDFSPWGMAFLCWESTRDAETEIYAGRKHCEAQETESSHQALLVTMGMLYIVIHFLLTFPLFLFRDDPTREEKCCTLDSR